MYVAHYFKCPNMKISKKIFFMKTKLPLSVSKMEKIHMDFETWLLIVQLFFYAFLINFSESLRYNNDIGNVRAIHH